MKNLLMLILTSVAVLVAINSRAQLELHMRPVQGVVVDQISGEPVPFATVSYARVDERGPRWTAVTDAQGRFRVSVLSIPGSYRLSVNAHGYHAVRDGLAQESRTEPIDVRVSLRPESLPVSERLAISVVGAIEDVRVLTAATLDAIELERKARQAAVSQNEVLGGDPDASGRLGDPLPPVLASSEDEGGSSRVIGLEEVDARQQLESKIGTGKARILRRGSGEPYLVGSNGAVPVSDTTLARLAEDSDELWILERSAGTSSPVGTGDPGTGCLVVIDPDQDTEIPVPLEHTDVHARIDGYIASVDVRQRFHNPFEETIEAEYVFPLPHDAAVDDFLMIIGERRIRGIIREKEEAREIYERARRAGHVASLLEQERPNIFRQRVANIEPGHAIEVELHYFNALPYRDGQFEFAFPLVVGPRFNPPNGADPIAAVPRGSAGSGTAVSYLAPSERSGHDVDITVELDAGVPIEHLGSVNHATRVQRDGRRRAVIGLADHDRIPNKDFVLQYRVAGDAIRSGVLVHREGDAGYFSMMLVPPASLESVERAPVEFVFVLDCSGSMRGWPMEQSKSAMRRALRQLRPGDSFQVIRFSQSASAFGPMPVEATPANVTRALRYIDELNGGGGTMMIEGIKAALDFPHDDERMRIVTFMTDGFIGNENEIFRAVAERLGDTRIFSFGVGSSVNRHLVEGLARMGRGAVAYIGLDDDLDAVDEFYRIVRHPAMTDISIDWGEMHAEQVFPQRIGDLYVGRPVLIHGRFSGSGSTAVTVRGRVGGRDLAMEVEVDLDSPVQRESLPLIWARSEIQHIADQLARRPDDSLMSRGLDLALNYNLVSEWTSFVAVDAAGVVDQPGTRTEPVPVPVPEGVDYETTVRGNGR